MFYFSYKLAKYELHTKTVLWGLVNIDVVERIALASFSVIFELSRYLMIQPRAFRNQQLRSSIISVFMLYFVKRF